MSSKKSKDRLRMEKALATEKEPSIRESPIPIENIPTLLKVQAKMAEEGQEEATGHVRRDSERDKRCKAIATPGLARPSTLRDAPSLKHIDSRVSELDGARVHKLVAELARRRCEALQIYEPLPAGKLLHESNAREVLAFGANRSSKTTTAAVEIARACTGQSNGKYPDKNGRCYIVGKDGKHIGEVIWRKLSRAEAFKMIRDPETNLWRAVRPKEEYDKTHRHLWKYAPPLIPPRFIEKIAWENKAQGIPLKVILKNGWEICFFSGLADPPNGVDIDILWFDEEILRSELWYKEGAARLLDRHGRFLWSATPQAATEQMLEVYQRSQEDTPYVKSFFFSLFENPHIDEEEKLLLASKYAEGTQDYNVRILGQFAILSHRVYPDWDMNCTHGVDAFPIPANWTKYAAVDPGHQVTAVLFGAVPPPDEENRPQGLYLYDELYIRNCDAMKFGEEFRTRTYSHQLEAFIIDRRMSRQTEVASGLTVELQYENALRHYGVRSNRTGTGFIAGSDDVHGGIEAVKRYMRIAKDGQPGIFCMREKLPNFQEEIATHRYKVLPNGIVTDDIVRKKDHLMSCARMLCAYEPEYVEPKKVINAERGHAEMIKEKKRLKRQQERKMGMGKNYIRLGPGVVQ